MFDKKSRLLICSAHPDDETIGMGGTIARARMAGAQVRIVFFGEGVTARYLPPQFGSEKVQAEIAERTANAVKACTILGVDPAELVFEDRTCCRFDDAGAHIDLIKAVEVHLDSFQPTQVFTHAAADTNIDHRIMHQAVLTAVRAIRYPEIELIALFEVMSSTEANPLAPFAPDLFIDISETFSRKVDALLAYGKEAGRPPHPRSPEALEGLARYRGAQAAMIYAEAFKTVRRSVR
ncbi:MAG: PIG-L family deacetylase [Alphaproteobacteria bacterium]|nr:PIG-L family deacetylase [Alphaproteobacteria bacterium]